MEYADLELLRQALAVLKDRGQATEAQDGDGFDPSYEGPGQHLAQRPLEEWEPGHWAIAWVIAVHHQDQLLQAGIDISHIPDPRDAVNAWYAAHQNGTDATPGLAISTSHAPTASEPEVEPGVWELSRSPHHLVLDGPYDEDMLAIRRTIPTRRFDRSGEIGGLPTSNVFNLSALVAEPLWALIERFNVSCTEAAFYTLDALSHDEPEPVPPAPKTLGVAHDRFVVVHPYDEAMLHDLRAIPGRRFDRDGRYGKAKTNIFPCVYESVEPLRRLAADYDLDISAEAARLMEELDAQQAQQAQQQASRQRLSRAHDAELEIEGLGGTLRPFQAAGVAYALETQRTFLADEMGLGKTIEALATLEAAQAYPALVVCPASVKLNWEREARQWLPQRSVAVLSGASPQASADVNVINYDILGRLVSQHEGGDLQAASAPLKAVVLDESHYIKNGKAQRSRYARTLGEGVMLRLCLSGTPIDNRPIELVSQLEFLGRLEDFGGFWAFADRYCAPVRHAHGWDFTGADHLDELHERLRGLCYIRRRKAEVLPELPAKQRVYVPVEISNRGEYKRAEKATIAWLGEQAARNQAFLGSIAHLTKAEQRRCIAERAKDAEERAARAEALVRIEALKQVCAQGKMTAVQDWIETFVQSGEKLVCFAWHEAILEQLAEVWRAPSITGKRSSKRRQAIIDAFQHDAAAQLVFLNMKAGGVGLTLTAASNALFVELGWTPTAHDQAEDRCHRIGQHDSVTAWYLIAKDTIDEDIYALLDDKRQVVEATTNGAKQEQELLGDVTQRLLAKA